jgi:hypothetical protein
MRFTSCRELPYNSPLIKGTLKGSNLELSKRFHRYAVLHRGSYIGDLTDRTNSALRALENYSDIKRELIVDGRKFDDCIAIWRSYRKTPNFEFELNIYGPISMKKAVGDALSDAKVYLQCPLSILEGVKLENPHLIAFPNLAVEEMTTMSWPSSGLAGPEMPPARNSGIPQVLDGLDHHDSLALEPTDHNIISTLLE